MKLMNGCLTVALAVAGSQLVGAYASPASANAPSYPTVQANGSAVIKGSVFRMINGLGENSSVYSVVPVNLGAHGSFSSKFKAVLSLKTTGTQADGVAFVVQNDPAGASALGGGGGCIGVCDIQNYAAIIFQSFTNNRAGLLMNGTYNTQPMNLGQQNDSLDVSVNYNGVKKTLTFRALNSTTGQTVTGQYAVDLSTLGTALYVGFSGGSGAYDSKETIARWSFSSHFKM